MNIGVTMFATDRSMKVHELAAEAEQRGFHSLYVPEHTHIPISRQTPPPTADEVLDEAYARTPDPITALAAAAVATETIRLGTAVALPAQHDPIAYAKSVATLDQLADGRFILGVGYGWNREEMADHGIAFSERRAIVREHMLACRALWADEAAQFTGRYVSLSPSWAWPKPRQQPRVRTLIGGGAGPKLFADIAEWADGWIPVGGAGLSTALPHLRARVEEAGRDPAGLHIVPMGIMPTFEKLDHYRQIGVTEAVLRVPSAGRDAVLPVLDEFTRYVGS